MKCKGCIEWVDEVGEAIPSEVPRCVRLNRVLTPTEYNNSAPKYCPYRDKENLGRGADEHHICYLVDDRDHYKILSEKYRGALETIVNNDECDDYGEEGEIMRDIAKQALEGDEE